MVNLAESVWRTGDGAPQLVQTRDLAVLFGSNHDRLTDPRRALRRRRARRWFASISDVEAKRLLLAVSAGSDPDGRVDGVALRRLGLRRPAAARHRRRHRRAHRRHVRRLRRARRADARQRDLDGEQGGAARRLDGARLLDVRSDCGLLEHGAGAVAVVRPRPSTPYRSTTASRGSCTCWRSTASRRRP